MDDSSPRFSKRQAHPSGWLLVEATALKPRQTNMLETLLFDYCEQLGIAVASSEPKNNKATTK